MRGRPSAINVQNPRGPGGHQRSTRLDHGFTVVLVRVATPLVLAALWVPILLPDKADRPLPVAFLVGLTIGSVAVLLWLRRMRQVWFDGSSFTIRDWFSRPVEVPKEHLVKVRAVPLKFAWVTLTFDPPTAYGAAVRVMSSRSGTSERFRQFADQMKAIAEKRPPTKRVPVPNDKAIAVRGWSKPELEQIIGDFRELYGIPADLPVALSGPENGTITLRFSADLGPQLFLFFVNYLHYPERLATEHRSVSVRGTCTLTADFQLPDPALVGRRATFFVPHDDTEFDYVMAALDGGETYRIPFTNLRWTAAERTEPR